MLELLKSFKEVCPAIDEKTDSPGAAPGQEEQLYDQGKKTEARCIEFTCVYVALTLFNTPGISARTDNGKKLRQNLKQALATLQAAKPAQPILTQDIQAISEFVEAESEEPPAKKVKT